MPRPREDKVPESRYRLAAVREEIKAAIGRKPRGTHTRLAAHLGMDRQQLSHYLGSPPAYELTIEMCGAIADYLDAPPGWPFLPWVISDRVFGPSKRT